jgi:endo-1,4-beta-xylanase
MSPIRWLCLVTITSLIALAAAEPDLVEIARRAADHGNLMPDGDPGTGAPFSLTCTGTNAGETIGVKAQLWSFVCWDASGQARAERRKAADGDELVLTNTAGTPSLQYYTWGKVNLPAGRIYEVTFAALGDGCAITNDGQERKLPLSGAAWKPYVQRIEARNALGLTLMFQNYSAGADHALHLRHLAITDIAELPKAAGGVIDRGDTPKLSQAAGAVWTTVAADLVKAGVSEGWLPWSSDELLRAEFVSFDGSAQAQPVDVTDAPGFSKAWHITTPKTDKEWYTHLAVANRFPVRQGDVIWVSAWCKVGATRNEWGQGVVCLYSGRGDYANSVEHCPGTWERQTWCWIADRDSPPGDVKLMWTFGQYQQEIWIGGITAIDCGPSAAIAKMPRKPMPLDYDGRAADAPWRGAALARIEQVRKADIVVKITDAQGAPRAGVPVHAAMQRQAFLFGCTLPTGILPEQSVQPWHDYAWTASVPAEQKARLVEQWLGMFNALNYGCTWSTWDGADARIDQEDLLATYRFAHAHGVPTVHQQVIYPSPEFAAPAWRARLDSEVARIRAGGQADPAFAGEFAAALKAHIADMARVMGPLGLRSFQIANELEDRPEYAQVLGGDRLDRVADWFRWAAEAAPDIERWINHIDTTDFYAETLTGLLARKAPVQGIGFQWHSGIGSPGPAQRLKGLDRFAAFGLPMQITELEIVITDRNDAAQRAFQADYVRDMLIAIYSHPAVNGLTLQDFWQTAAWQRDGGSCFFDNENQLQPHGQQWLDLVRKQWWTNADAVTDAQGVAHLRGFHGDYRIDAGGVSAAATLGSTGTTVALVVP